MYKFLCASFTACRHILYFQNLFNVILFHHIAEFEFPKNQTIQTTGRYLFCCFIFEDSAFNKMLVNRQKKLLVAFHFELYLCRQPQPVICIYSICQQNLPTQMVRKLFCDSFFCAINQNLQKSVDGKIMNCLGSKRKKYFTHLKCQCHEIVWHEFNPPGPQDSFSPGLGIRSF